MYPAITYWYAIFLAQTDNMKEPLIKIHLVKKLGLCVQKECFLSNNVLTLCTHTHTLGPNCM